MYRYMYMYMNMCKYVAIYQPCISPKSFYLLMCSPCDMCSTSMTIYKTRMHFCSLSFGDAGQSISCNQDGGLGQCLCSQSAQARRHGTSTMLVISLPNRKGSIDLFQNYPELEHAGNLDKMWRKQNICG